MNRISVLALKPGEAAQILSACKFFSFDQDISYQLFVPEEELKGLNSDNFAIAPFKELLTLRQNLSPPAPSSSDVEIVFFCSLISANLWQEISRQVSPTLFVHKDMAILEVKEAYSLPPAFFQAGLKPCFLREDAALDLVKAPKNLITEYLDIRAYFSHKSTKNLLITANLNLVMTLVSLDVPGWEIYHPGNDARNIGLDLAEDRHSQIVSRLSEANNQIRSGLASPGVYSNLASSNCSKQLEEQAYSFFANHYDEYMKHVDYDLWVSKILVWFSKYSSLKLSRILELACGTANVSEKLVFQGYEVHASDLSAQMLHIASQKPFKPALYQASLTDPIPASGYQLVLCMFDSINYLSTVAQLKQMLDNVYNSLADKGLFIFDISTLLNSEDNFSDISNLSFTQDGVLMQSAWFDENKMTQSSRLILFRKEALGYSYHKEQHSQRVFLCGELLEIISHTHFKLLAIHTTDKPANLYPKQLNRIDEKYYRLFFILQREA